MDFIKDSIGNIFMNSRESWTDKIIYKVKFEIWKLEKRIIRSITAIFFLLLSFAAFALAAIFFLIEYLNFTKALSFLIIAIILLLIGIILKMRR